MAQRARNTLVTGIAARLPGAADLDAFWRLLDEGRCAVSAVGPDRFDIRPFHHPRPGAPGRSYTFAAGLIDDVFGFDAAFFGISPREAAQIDPQQRILLQVVWEAVESAGLRAADLAGSNTGVYVGASALDYYQRLLFDLPSTDTHLMTGNTLSIVSNRLSYVFDLRGPSFTVDTACSSSLVALHEAVCALERGEIDTAIVAGVNLLLSPFSFIGFARASMLSRQGLCRAFDKSGDGYVRSEGAVALVLQRADARLARRARGRILATGTNSDGRTAGLSLPSSTAQERLLRDIYHELDLSPDALAFIEAHGTGTQVGDPAEATALGRALGQARSRPLPIGSAKTNVGHLEPVSGLVGVVKALLALEKGVLPRTLHFETPNPNIDFEGLNLAVAAEPVVLARTDGTPRLAGVNSFGFGGTNAHAVLADAPEDGSADAASPVPATAPLVISARSQAALRALAGRYGDLIEARPAAAGAVIDAAVRLRDLHDHRLVVLGDADEKRAALAAHARGEGHARAVAGKAGPRPTGVAFAFSGNGAQWAGMGQVAYRGDGTFREAFQEVDRNFMSVSGWSLVTMLFSADLDAEIDRTEVAQPLLFALQVALTTSLAARGISPSAVLGHSVGEVAAAWCAGLLDLATATRIIHARSTQQEVVRDLGSMAAVLLPEAAAREAIERSGLAGIEISAVNSPRSVTVSGPTESIEAFARLARDERWALRRLDIAYPFHSALVDPIEAPLRKALGQIRTGEARLPLLSSVHPNQETIVPDATYWWENVRRPVLFQDAAAALARLEIDVVIEIGPRPVLANYLRDSLRAAGRAPTVLASFEQPGARVAMGEDLEAIAARLVAHGARPDLDRYVGPAGGNLPDLPHMPWQAVTCRVEQTPERLVMEGPPLTLAGMRPRPEAPVWFNVIDTDLQPYLADHRVERAVVFPAAGYLEMMLAVGRAWLETDGVEIRNLEILRPLVLDEGKSVETLVRLSPDDRVIEMLSRPRLSEAGWSLHARADLRTLAGEAPQAGPRREEDGSTLDADGVYELTRAFGLDYGPRFRRLRQARVLSRSQAEAWLEPEAYDALSFALDPMLADAAFHGLFALLAGAAAERPDTSFLPLRFDRVRLFRPGGIPVRVMIEIVRASERSIVADFDLFDEDDQPVARLERVRFRAVDLQRAVPDRHPLSYHVGARLLSAPDEPLRSADATAPLRAALEHLRSGGLIEDGEAASEPADDTLLLDALARGVALDALRAAGGAPARSDAATDPGADVGGDRFFALAEAALAELEIHGLARRDQDGWEIADEKAAPGVPDLLQALMATSGRHAVEAALLLRAGETLARGWTGAADETPGPAFAAALLDAWRNDGAAARALAATARRIVDLLVSAWPRDTLLRVLLVGAGNRSLVEDLCAAMPQDRVEISITDPDTARLERLERSWSGPAGVRFRSPQELAGAGGLATIDVAMRLGRQARPDKALARALAGRLRPDGLEIAVDEAMTFRHRLVEGLAGAAREPGAQDGATGLPGLVEHLEGPAAGGDGAVRIRVARRTAALVQASDGPAATDAAADAPRLLLVPLGEVGAEGAAPLLRALRRGGADVTLGLAGATTQPRADTHWDIALDGEAIGDLRDLAGLAAAAADGIVCLGDVGEDPTALATATWQAMQVLRTNLARSAPLVLVAPGGALFAPFEAETAAPAAAGLWAFARVAMNEFPDLRLFLVDPGEPGAGGAEAAAREVLELVSGGADEREIALRGGRRYGLRIDRGPELPETTLPSRPLPETLRLSCAGQGSLDRLVWQNAPRKDLAADEVEIEVEASGLNFRDVMWALGLLPEEALEDGFAGPTLGMECCGRVVRTGAAVSRLRPGERVIAFAPAAFAKHVTVSESGCALAPPGLAPEAAATIPVAFLTCQYAIVELGRIAAGDTVLIHGGAGGVGLAAIQIARHAGATVIATAGSPEKRALLTALGADHVLDSRSLDFADAVMRLTGGQGVDIVLNSLSGEAMERSIDVLKPFGRFLELGKRDYYENRRLGLRPFRRNISYFGIDADQLLLHRPALARQLLARLVALFEDETLVPLPYRSFPAERAVDAFRLMQQAGHIGKIVLLPPDSVPAPDRIEPLTLTATDVEVVAGGFGGFGAQLVRRLADRGARRIAVLGRSGGDSDEARALVAELAAAGVTVLPLACDITRDADVASALDRVRAELGAIRGVYHTAMVLQDTLIANMTRAALDSVLAPKAAGAALLDRLTRADPVERFVLFSSATTLVGNPGQANYVAANGFLEGLAARRRAQGLPGLAVAWGAISDAGYLARNAETGALLARKLGRHALTAAEALDGLFAMLAAGQASPRAPGEATGEATGLPPVIGFARIDWSAARRDLALLATPLAERLGLSAADGADGSGEQVDLARLVEGLGHAEALARVTALLAEEIGRILRIAASEIDPTRPLVDIGMDSLMALELRMAAERQFGIDIPLMSLANGATLSDMASRILATVSAGNNGPSLSAEARDSMRQHVGEDGDGIGDVDGIDALAEQVERKMRDMKSIL